MPPRKKAVAEDTTVYTVTVCGKSYDKGVRDRFPVKPVSRRKVGYGHQYKFEVNRSQLRELADILADMACPEDGDAPEDIVNAVYSDLAKFPPAAGVA